MPSDMTPEERAEALRLLNDAGFAAEAVRNAGLVACAQWIDDAAAALDAAEFERAELAREVERDA